MIRLSAFFFSFKLQCVDTNCIGKTENIQTYLQHSV